MRAGPHCDHPDHRGQQRPRQSPLPVLRRHRGGDLGDVSGNPRLPGGGSTVCHARVLPGFRLYPGLSGAARLVSGPASERARPDRSADQRSDPVPVPDRLRRSGHRSFSALSRLARQLHAADLSGAGQPGTGRGSLEPGPTGLEAGVDRAADPAPHPLHRGVHRRCCQFHRPAPGGDHLRALRDLVPHGWGVHVLRVRSRGVAAPRCSCNGSAIW